MPDVSAAPRSTTPGGTGNPTDPGTPAVSSIPARSDTGNDAEFATPRAAWIAGATSVTPFLVGTIPFGLVTGIATKAAGLSLEASMAMTLMVFAGTAQISALPLITAGAPALVIILTAFIVNLRFMIYSATVAPYFKDLPLRWKFLIGYFVTDTGFAMFMRKVADRPHMTNRHWYFLGGGMIIGLVWSLSALVGIVAGARVPASWQLEFAATVGILAILAAVIRSKAELSAAIIGGSVALAAMDMPMKLGLVLGALAGIAGGVLTERMLARLQAQTGTGS